MTTDSWLAIIAIVQVFGAVLLVIFASTALARGRELGDQVNGLLATARTSLINLDSTVRELREARLVEKAAQALAGASGAVGRIDPLATELSATLSGARDLLDDVAQTSQSVRARVDDLAATQHELNALTGTLADVAGQLRDAGLVDKLGNILHDAALLAADVGMLTENVNHYLETGKPLVDNLSGLVSRTRERAGKVTSAIGGLKDDTLSAGAAQAGPRAN
jgi:methyl-accepting chemotaxis protein